jgi:hypothetical protein
MGSFPTFRKWYVRYPLAGLILFGAWKAVSEGLQTSGERIVVGVVAGIVLVILFDQRHSLTLTATVWVLVPALLAVGLLGVSLYFIFQEIAQLPVSVAIIIGAIIIAYAIIIAGAKKKAP